MNTRYKNHPSFSSEASDNLFIVTHNQLGEVHERMGEALKNILPDFGKLYKKYSPFEGKNG